MERKFWRHRRVLITGATGLLGSELTVQLQQAGAEVVAYYQDHIPQSRFYELGLNHIVRMIEGSVTDLARVKRVLSEYEIETVFHLAAQTIVGIAERDPYSTLEANVRGTYTVLEACRLQKHVKGIVVASSDKAYGSSQNLPYTEAQPLQGRAPYDVSKSCADLICQSYFSTYGLPVALTRSGNFFGPGDLNWSRIIPSTIRSFYYNEAPILRSNGLAVRDYIYVGDVAQASILIAEQLEGRKLAGEAFNIAYDQKHTVLDVVSAIAQQMGKSHLKPHILNQAENEISEQYLTSEKLRSRLGWKPAYDFQKGLVETISWYTQKLAAGDYNND